MLLSLRKTASRFAVAAAAATALLAGGSGTALAADAHFVPEATAAGWDGRVATVSFQEADVAPDADATTISVKVTVDVKVLCTRGQSTLDIRKSATVLEVAEYPIDADGTVAGTAELPLEVPGLQVPGYACVKRHLSITAALEDFRTGATLVYQA